MNFLVNNEIAEEKWIKFLISNNLSSPFVTSTFYKFFNSLDGNKADVFAIEQDGKLKALILVTIQQEKGIKSYFSRRGIVYGGAALDSQNEQVNSMLLEKAIQHYKGQLIYLEQRNYHDYSQFKETYIKSGFNYIPWLNFHLDVNDIPLVKKNMSSSRLRQIKKAIKNGAEWREAQTENEVIAFYTILKELYEEKIKKPIFPIEFFIEFFRQNIGKYLLIYFDDKVIGGIMCPIQENNTIYEYYVCGLDSDYKDQYPSIMATWAAIEYASQNNIPLFDFMGAGSPDIDYGVREFKSRFGGEQVEYGRFLYIINPFLYRVGELGLSILSKLKK